MSWRSKGSATATTKCWRAACITGASFLWGFAAVCVGSCVLLVPWLGRDFFPRVDAGQFKLHLRARAGTRIEETAGLCDRIESFIREEIPPSEISSIIDNIGLPYSSINLSYSNSAPTGPADADILVTLTPGHRPTEEYVHDLRLKLGQQFPGVDFSFLPADIVSQILNFGLPSPIDIQVTGYNLRGQPRALPTNCCAGSRWSRARPTCASSSPSMSPICTSTWTAPRRNWPDSRSATLPPTC